MRRLWTALVAFATLTPGAAALAAVSMTPPSASMLPAFEIVSSGRTIRVSASDLGAVTSDKGLRIDNARFDQAIAKLTNALGHAPVAASYQFNNNQVQLQPGRPGYVIDPPATRAMLLRALRGSRSNLTLPIKHVPAPPPPTYAIVVYLRNFGLDVYRGPSITQHFPVGVGALQFPTPPGAYYVKSKAKNPSWSNPGSRWARYMPRYIAPGPRNPLGSRALRLDRGALVIHGTPQPWSIGRRASHGCIRMKRPDVERLYDLVPQGTPVFIVP